MLTRDESKELMAEVNRLMDDVEAAEFDSAEYWAAWGALQPVWERWNAEMKAYQAAIEGATC